MDDASSDKIKITNESAELLCKQRSQINQLKSIIYNLPGDIYWKDTAGVWLGVNKTGLESLIRMGFAKSEEDVIGKTDYQLFDKSTADEYRKNDLEVMRLGVQNTTEEAVLLPNGQTIIQLSTKRPLRDESGQIIGIVGNTIDITHLKKIEADLRIAKENAEQLSSVKMDFIRNMEHDIRTPLTGAWGISKYLHEQENSDPEKKELLGGITSCVKELLSFCDTIIHFSRLDSKIIPLSNAAFDVRQLLTRLYDMEWLAAKDKQLDLLFECDDDVPTLIMGDEYRLYRILLNLISNAIKFTHAGKVYMHVKQAKKMQNTILLEFIIQDTGIGIPQDKQSYIFEIFSRINPSNQGKYTGLGLGLHIVKRYIQELKGDIIVESEIEKGSTFICTIPFGLPHQK